MGEVGLAFITGLTAGGLSCIAVQAGLLATAMADETETELEQTKRPGETRGPEFSQKLNELQQQNLSKKRYKNVLVKLKARYPKHQQAQKKPEKHRLQAIVLFLLSRIAAYAVLGLLIGLIGAQFQWNTNLQGYLQIFLGLLMIGIALRLVSKSPIFRIFSLEPPASVRRFIRKQTKLKGEVVTPIILGALTILIPCGITQAILLKAATTGQPIQAMFVVAAFILGTTPIFFIFAITANKLSEKHEKLFVKIAAIFIVVMAVLSINGGLNLLGSPFSYDAIKQSLSTKDSSTQSTTIDPNAESLTINVTSYNYEPATQNAKANTPYQLKLVTNNTSGCGRYFVIPALKQNKVLPETGTETMNIPAQPAGSTLRLTCSMGMYNAQIQFN